MLEFFIWFIALLVAITIHEFAHAWMADYLGDPTARLSGRLTLNPLAHLDPLGTLALFLFHFGWGKPVPVDPFNLRDPRRDAALISLAGPAANLILATVLSLILKLGAPLPLLFLFFQPIIVLNVSLAVFNLLPVYPLDGEKILLGFLSEKKAHQWEKTLSQYGPFFIILLLFPLYGTSLASLVISPLVNFILSLLLPGLPLI